MRKISKTELSSRSPRQAAGSATSSASSAPAPATSPSPPAGSSNPDRNCPLCPRLAEFRNAARAREPSWFNSPVPSFGDTRASLLIVGLAPGLQGANRTGRPFTGDYAGVLLYQTLYDFGFGSRPTSVARDDRLVLKDCRITNAVKCLPPENKPEPAEIRTCNPYLAEELRASPEVKVILALGLVAHKAVLMAQGLRQSACTFAHGACHDLPDGRALIDSYHCSRYNTQTRRLTDEAFRDVFRLIQERL